MKYLLMTLLFSTNLLVAQSLYDDLNELKDTKKISTSLTQFFLNTPTHQLNSLSFGLCIEAGNPSRDCTKVKSFIEALCMVGGHSFFRCQNSSSKKVALQNITPKSIARLYRGIGWGLCTLVEEPTKCANGDTAKGDLSWGMCVLSGEKPRICSLNQLK